MYEAFETRGLLRREEMAFGGERFARRRLMGEGIELCLVANVWVVGNGC